MERTITTKAICLNYNEFNDYDRLIKLFSVDLGLITAKIRGIKKATAKLKMASETFCFAEYNLLVIGDHYQVIGATIIDSFFKITRDFELFSLSNILLESTSKSLQEKIQNPKLFINLLKSLKAICYEDKNPQYVVGHYICYLLNILGYKLNTATCSNCSKPFEKNLVCFDYSIGNFLCQNCNRYGKPIKFEFLTFVKLIAETPVAESDKINFSELNMIFILKFLIEDLENRIDKDILSDKNYFEFIELFRKKATQ